MDIKQEIRPRGCFECEYCKEQIRWPSRNAFICKHPDQDYIKAYCNLHRMVKMPGFISFSEPTKRRQRYCPLARAEKTLRGDGDGI